MGITIKDTQAVASASQVVWFHCKGCGRFAGYVLVEGPDTPEQGSALHAKPTEKLNVPLSTGCDLYNRLSAEDYWKLHQDAERIEGVVSIHPADN